MRFIANLKSCVKNRRELKTVQPGSELSNTCSVSTLTQDAIIISEEETNASKLYFFRKATSEVKYFLKASRYRNISQEVESTAVDYSNTNPGFHVHNEDGEQVALFFFIQN